VPTVEEQLQQLYQCYGQTFSHGAGLLVLQDLSALYERPFPLETAHSIDPIKLAAHEAQRQVVLRIRAMMEKAHHAPIILTDKKTDQPTHAQTEPEIGQGD